jgi:hypothetical protein
MYVPGCNAMYCYIIVLVTPSGLMADATDVRGRVCGRARMPTASKGRELVVRPRRAPTSRTSAMLRRSGLARVPTVTACIAKLGAHALGIYVDTVCAAIADELRRWRMGSTSQREEIAAGSEDRRRPHMLSCRFYAF